LDDRPTRDARPRRPSGVGFLRAASTDVVLALVQHDTPPTDAIEREVGSVDGHALDAASLRTDVAEVAPVTTGRVQTSVSVRAGWVVMGAHARTALGHVASLVHVESVKSVRQAGHAHVAKGDVHSTSSRRLVERHFSSAELCAERRHGCVCVCVVVGRTRRKKGAPRLVRICVCVAQCVLCVLPTCYAR
jgi:hypothetical protein